MVSSWEENPSSSPSQQQKSSALQWQQKSKISLGKESMTTAVGACICGGM